jgi:hypothetical protein
VFPRVCKQTLVQEPVLRFRYRSGLVCRRLFVSIAVKSGRRETCFFPINGDTPRNVTVVIPSTFRNLFIHSGAHTLKPRSSSNRRRRMSAVGQEVWTCNRQIGFTPNSGHSLATQQLTRMCQDMKGSIGLFRGTPIGIALASPLEGGML